MRLIDIDIAQSIKKWRKQSNMTVKNAVEALKEYGFIISEKTLYNWENGTRMPDADVFFALCDIYDIIDINTEISIIKKIAPTEQLGESEEMLLHNYKLLNNQGKKRLIEYSHDLTEIPKYASSDSEEKKPRMVPIKYVARNGLISENEIPEDVANEISEKLKTPHSDFKW